jgi:hypothetical protein
VKAARAVRAALAGREASAVGSDRLLVAASIALTAFLLLILTTYGYGRDQGIYALVADTITQGGAPYKDAWDFKPPMIFFVYAFSRGLLGSQMVAIRLVEAAAFASLVVAFVVFSRRHVGDWRAGLVGGTLAVLAYVQLEFWHTAQPESFGAVATAWALVCATYEPRSGDSRASFKLSCAWGAAGLLYAFAALLKPPLGGGFLVSLGFVVAEQRRGRGSRPLAVMLKPVLTFGAGALAMLSATALYFLWTGAWGDLVEALFVFAPAYTGIYAELGRLDGFLYKALQDSLFAHSAYVPVGLALLIGLRPLAPSERRGAQHVAGVAAFQIVGVALQAKLFPYHYAATLTLASLLAGWGIWKLWLRIHARPLYTVAFLAALVWLHDTHPARPSYRGSSFLARVEQRLKLLSGEADQRLVDRLHSVSDVDAAANRRTAAWLREHVPAEASVFVWGFEPVLYDTAERRPASRYIHNLPQRLKWSGQDEARAALMRDLERDPPAAIVVVEGDFFRNVTGNRLDSRGTLRRFRRLRELIERDYEPARRFADLEIIVRR